MERAHYCPEGSRPVSIVFPVHQTSSGLYVALLDRKKSGERFLDTYGGGIDEAGAVPSAPTALFWRAFGKATVRELAEEGGYVLQSGELFLAPLRVCYRGGRPKEGFADKHNHFAVASLRFPGRLRALWGAGPRDDRRPRVRWFRARELSSLLSTEKAASFVQVRAHYLRRSA